MSELKEIPAEMVEKATAAAIQHLKNGTGDYEHMRQIAIAILEAAGVVKMAERITQLEAELAKHQESSFHPDWSLLDATRESLREAQARIAEMEKQLAADALIARLSEDDEQWQQFERTFMERFADEPNIIRECLLATAEVKTEIAWQSINQAQEARTND